MKMSYLDYRKMTGQKSISKMRNVITEYNGKKYHSKKEAGYAQYLDGLVSLGEVREWQGQVKYKITLNKASICTYILDFKVIYSDGRIEYVDVKPFDKRRGKYILTATYSLKKKMMKAEHKISIKEV